VPLYNAFLQMYEGKPLPPPAGMLNALRNNFGISEKDSSVVLDRLLESADTAGLFAVTGDRSKMIRPPLVGATSMHEPIEKASRAAQAVAATRETALAEAGHGLPSRGKLLDGMWELLPDDNSWDEGDLQTWLRMLTMALRVRYRLQEP
jgi:hypothetical protein